MSTIDKLIKRQIKLTILSVIAVVLITSTITYALYQTNHENAIDQVISIGNLGLTATGTPITLEGLYPMEEYDLTSSYPRYNFTLENKTNGVNNDYTLMYELVLRVDENTTLSQDDYQYIMYKIDGSEAKPLLEVWDSEINGFKILDGRLLSHEETTLSTDLTNKDIENHSIVFWLSTYAPNSVQGKVLTLKMSLEAYADRFNYLKYYEYADNNVFGKTLNRSDFENITTLDKIDIPLSAIESWDVSNQQNKSIMAWYTDDDNNGLYELYLGQDGGVIANPNCAHLFRLFLNVDIIDVTNLNTSFTTNMQFMFSGGENTTFTYDYSMKVQSINGLEKFNTKNVTNMRRMFFVCSYLEEINVTSFNTERVVNMREMFSGYYDHSFQSMKLNSLDVSNFDTSNVENMQGMFFACINIKKLDLSNFDMSKVTTFTLYFGIFQYMYRLEVLDISGTLFKPNVNASKMFYSINANAKIITNECAEEFVRARLAEANRSSVTLEVVPCVKVCYSNNINNILIEYTELEYIESTGTQYIDSGYKPTPNTGVYADFQFTTTTAQQRLFGVGSDKNISNTLSYELYINGSNKIAYAYRDNYGNWLSTNVNADTNRHVLSFNVNNDRRISIDNGIIYNSTLVVAAINTASYNLPILARYYMDSNIIKQFAYTKLYSFKIYENGILVRNYIPALRNSDNSIGLYETEEGRFYENSGTGVFNSGVFNSNIIQTLTGNTLQLAHTIDARPGYTFVGWNTKPDGSGTTFKQGEEVDIEVLKSLGDGTITLYAMWEEN